MKKVRLYGTRNVRTAGYNWAAARFFLDLAEKKVDGSFFNSQASLLFSAFAHEAFLNTLGPKILPAWSDHEFASPEDKLKLICDKISYKTKTGRRPYQTLKKLFWFRNLIAHGREETLQIEGRVVKYRSSGGYLDAVESQWERYCTTANARRACADVFSVATDLCERANVEPFPGQPFGSPFSSFFQVESVFELDQPVGK